MIRVLLSLLLMVSPTTTVAHSPTPHHAATKPVKKYAGAGQVVITSFPISPDRAKFPKEKGELIDGFAYINWLVNHSIKPMEDQEQYGRPEVWVMNPVSGYGDCEDYALTKLQMLSDADYPTVLSVRIRGVAVQTDLLGKVFEGHAILEILAPNGSIIFMDNLNPDHLMTRAELEANGYVFADW